MPARRIRLLAALALGTPLGFLACHDTATGPGPAGAPPRSVDSPAGPSFLTCEVREPARATNVIGLFGGALSLGANRLDVPLGAVVPLTGFQLAIPATSRAQIDLTAEGVLHFVFDAPVTVTIDLSHCPDSELAGEPLTVWYVDGDTGAPLENMGGIFDPATRTIRFTTDHFSSYAVAH